LLTAGTAAHSTSDLQRLDRSHIVHPHQVVGHPAEPIVVARGRGCTIWDTDGREYLDATCGLWQCAVGHGRSELVQVGADQMGQIEFYASFWDYSNQPAILLAERLAELSDDSLGHVHFTNGGSEGNALAIKLARLAWDHAGKPERDIILSRQGAYHGSGAGASLSATGIPSLKEGFDPLMEGFVHLSRAHARRVETDALIDELVETIERIGADCIAAFIGEPVMGVAGVIPPPEGYWPRVEAVLREHDILLILDEVITAYGRLGHWFGYERFGVRPDFVVTAKAITSGYFPFGAVMIGDRPMELLDGRMLRHGFTYNGHPVGAAVALENLAIIERENLVQAARERGERLGERLQPLEELDGVAEVRGDGLMWGIELEGNRDAVELAAAVRNRGVIVRGLENRIVMSPPFVVTEDEVDRIAGTLEAELERLG
jgi:adenosylmethionine-8-amino-7-oxononanoate aminotransferase